MHSHSLKYYIKSRVEFAYIVACVKLALTLSLVVIVGQMIHMVTKYKLDTCHHYSLSTQQNSYMFSSRSSMKRLCRGDKSFLPENLPSPAVICVSSDMPGFDIHYVRTVIMIEVFSAIFWLSDRLRYLG